MSLVNLDPALLITVGYVSLGIAVAIVLWTVSVGRASTTRKGQQHPLGWRHSANS